MQKVISIKNYQTCKMLEALGKAIDELKKKDKWEDPHICIFETKNGFMKRMVMPKLPYIDLPIYKSLVAKPGDASELCSSVSFDFDRVRFYLTSEENDTLIYKEY